MPGFEVSPSLVSAPLLGLEAALAELRQAGVSMLHIDIEDGHFVPVMNLGTRFIEQLRGAGFVLDVHLMVADPETIIPLVARLGADAITFHYEASRYPRRHLRAVRELGLQAGLAFNPKTPLPAPDYLVDQLDCLLILTSEPEEPDSPFLPGVLPKLTQARAWAAEAAPGLRLVADGGVSAANIASVLAAGADTVVVGRALFAPPGPRENLASLQAAADA